MHYTLSLIITGCEKSGVRGIYFSPLLADGTSKVSPTLLEMCYHVSDQMPQIHPPYTAAPPDLAQTQKSLNGSRSVVLAPVLPGYERGYDTLQHICRPAPTGTLIGVS